MPRVRRHRLDTERGQILVIVAGGLIALLAITALALEGGTLMLNRRDAQNSADIASLAGARMVSLNYTAGGRTQAQVYQAVNDSLGLNDCAPASTTPCTWDAQFVGASLVDLGPVANSGAALPSGTIGVRVGVNRAPGALIGRVIGFQSWSVSTEATAISAKQKNFPAGVLLPIALCGWGQTGVNDCLQASNSPARPDRLRGRPDVRHH